MAACHQCLFVELIHTNAKPDLIAGSNPVVNGKFVCLHLGYRRIDSGFLFSVWESLQPDPGPHVAA
jgi:hypothetical protein